MSKYHDLHRASIETPEEFWAQAAEGIDWVKRWDRVVDLSLIHISEPTRLC